MRIGAKRGIFVIATREVALRLISGEQISLPDAVSVNLIEWCCSVQ